MDWNGQWTRELVELMLPVAWECESNLKRVTAEGVTSGIGSAFSKDGFAASARVHAATIKAIRAVQRVVRGGSPEDPHAAEDAAQALREGFGGLRRPRGRSR